MRWFFAVVLGLMLVVVAVGAEVKGNAEDEVLGKLQVFPKGDEWNRDVTGDAVDVRSVELIAEIGAGKGLHPDFGRRYGIPFQLVDGRTPRVVPVFEYGEESDGGGYPVPEDVKIEGVLAGGAEVKGDRHILCVDAEAGKLYEMWSCQKVDGVWRCGSGAIFDLGKVSTGQRKVGWTSADAAGLPVFAGLARYDEICVRKELTHALRFTVVKSSRRYVFPATHFASRSKDMGLPPMGMRVRLRAGFDVSGFPAEDQVILRGLKKYGMILADNGSDWFVSGAPDARWDDEALGALKKVKGKEFEVVKMP